MKHLVRTLLLFFLLLSLVGLYSVNSSNTHFSYGYFCGNKISNSFEYGSPIDPGISGSTCSDTAVVPTFGSHYINLEVLNIVFGSIALISIIGLVAIAEKTHSKIKR